MNNHFDDPWLDALAGQGPDNGAVRMVRHYFVQRREQDEAILVAPDREAKMLTYLRKKRGLREPQGAFLLALRDWLAKFLSSISHPRLVAASLMTIMCIFAITLSIGPSKKYDAIPSDMEIFRGNQPVVQISSATPLKTTESIEEILKKHGVVYRKIQLVGNIHKIEASIKDHDKEVESALATWNVRIPANGILVMLVSPTSVTSGSTNRLKQD
jgi:hypothetical protein